MNRYVVEHKANVPGVREQPVLWASPVIVARSAEMALWAFYDSKFGFKPSDEHEYLHVRKVTA